MDMVNIQYAIRETGPLTAYSDERTKTDPPVKIAAMT